MLVALVLAFNQIQCSILIFSAYFSKIFFLENDLIEFVFWKKCIFEADVLYHIHTF